MQKVVQRTSRGHIHMNRRPSYIFAGEGEAQERGEGGEGEVRGAEGSGRLYVPQAWHRSRRCCEAGAESVAVNLNFLPTCHRIDRDVIRCPRAVGLRSPGLVTVQCPQNATSVAHAERPGPIGARSIPELPLPRGRPQASGLQAPCPPEPAVATLSSRDR